MELTPDQIVRLLEAFPKVSHAARDIGAKVSTVHDWLQRARRGKVSGKSGLIIPIWPAKALVEAARARDINVDALLAGEDRQSPAPDRQDAA